MDFSTIKNITIPEGSVTKITDSLGNVIWKKAIPMVTIHYVTAHGTAPADKEVPVGYALTSADLPNLSASGWTFKGWDKSVGYVVNVHTTITASWQASTFPFYIKATGGQYQGSIYAYLVNSSSATSGTYIGGASGPKAETKMGDYDGSKYYYLRGSHSSSSASGKNIMYKRVYNEAGTSVVSSSQVASTKGDTDAKYWIKVDSYNAIKFVADLPTSNSGQLTVWVDCYPGSY